MDNEQARIIGQEIGEVFADKIIRWIERANPNRQSTYGAAWFIEALGEAIGRAIASKQKEKQQR